MVRAVEFMPEALVDLEDLPEIARHLTRMADVGRIVCGQPDPWLWELQIGEKRIVYRVEEDEILVLTAEVTRPVEH